MEHGGQVLRFIGDAALAIFPIEVSGDTVAGKREAHENALAAALSARERMAAVNERRVAKNRAPLRYGIGLHPGEVTYGNIGTESRLEFTVIGDAANQAARIESMCKVLDRNLVVSAPFAKMFPQQFASMGLHRMRGIADELELFVLARWSSGESSGEFWGHLT